MLLRFFLLFVALWQCGQGEKCHYIMHANQGIIKSPNHPDSYPNNAICSWFIQVGEGYKITLKIKSFMLEGRSPSCRKDSVMIYNGQNATAKAFDSPYCGRNIPTTFQSSTNFMLIRFTSDAHETFSGFEIHYTAEKHCNGTLNADNGTITSPRYPKNYSPNSDCHWMITTSPGTIIRIEVKDFEMEGSQVGIDQCYDYLAFYSIYGSKRDLIGQYCGKHIPQVIVSHSNKMEIYMYTDATEAKRGFRIQFSAQKPKVLPTTKPLTTRGQVCKDDEFKCRNGRCLNMQLRCNQVDDCGDHSDEISCAGSCSNNNGGCEHKCKTHPVWQSYCVCNDGFVLAEDKKSCQDVDECRTNNGGCGDVCSNFVGGYKCECARDGYQIGADGKTCQDIDECVSNRCDHLCENTIGSYRCKCKPGFRATSSGSCVDIDECAFGVPSCFDCVNTIGSYRCNCDKGFVAVKNSSKCADVDECENNKGGCSQLCTNTYGSYHCHCMDGFMPHDSSGKICVDVNECQTLGRRCEHNCVNSPGSYACTCRSGFKLENGTKCVASDDCRYKIPYPCQYGCANSGESIRCTCPDGYLLHSNGRDCYEPVNKTDCGIMQSFAPPYDTLSTVTSNKWSWQAYLLLSFPIINLHMKIEGCLATLINKQYLITAAHCLFIQNTLISPSQLRVKFTLSADEQDGGKQFSVGKILVHPDYRFKNKRNKADIALIKLLQPIGSRSNNIQPICMGLNKKLQTGDYAYVISRGRLNELSYSPVLSEMRIQIQNATNCSWLQAYGYDTTETICAGYFTEKEKTCLLDSGSPLMIESPSKHNWYLSGILIHGAGYPRVKPCSKWYKSSAFYDMSNYKQWIRDQIK